MLLTKTATFNIALIPMATKWEARNQRRSNQMISTCRHVHPPSIFGSIEGDCLSVWVCRRHRHLEILRL